MKAFLANFLIGMLLFCNPAQALEDDQLTLEPIPVDQVYVPAYVTDDEDARMVISGILPNLCYDSPEIKFQISGQDIIVDLLALNSQYGDRLCAEMIRPVLKLVNVGRLSAGEYRILAGEFVVSRLIVESVL